MKDPRYNTSTDPSTTRRTFLQAAGLGAAALAAHGAAYGAEKPKIVDKYGNPEIGRAHV